MFKIRDMTLREFVRQYALRVPEKDVLQFGLLLASGDSPEQAFRLALNNDKDRLAAAYAQLERLGYIKRLTDERENKLRPVVANLTAVVEESSPDVEVPGQEDG